jgi:hypothetical protein
MEISVLHALRRTALCLMLLPQHLTEFPDNISVCLRQIIVPDGHEHKGGERGTGAKDLISEHCYVINY